MTKQPERPTCATCPYWDRQGDDNNERENWCIRNAPAPMFATMYGIAAASPQAKNAGRPCIWPLTDADDSCGEHPDFPDWIKATRAS